MHVIPEFIATFQNSMHINREQALGIAGACLSLSRHEDSTQQEMLKLKTSLKLEVNSALIVSCSPAGSHTGIHNSLKPYTQYFAIHLSTYETSIACFYLLLSVGKINSNALEHSEISLYLVYRTTLKP